MSFRFVLRFTGLCALVPHTSGTRARVLLLGGRDNDEEGEQENEDLESRSPAMGGHAHQGHVPETHYPAIVFDMQNWSPASVRRPDIRFFEEGVEKGVCLLNDQDIEILSNSTETFNIIGFGRNGANPCPGVDDEGNLSWIAPMERILRGAGNVATACLGTSNVPPAVSARVRLTQGTLRNGDFAHNEGGLLRWQFEPAMGGAPGHEQALSEIVELELAIPGDQVLFAATLFRQLEDEDTPQQLPPLSLIPVPAEGGADGRLEVFVKSIPLEDLLATRPAELVNVGGSRRRRDEHFEHYFRLSTGDPGPGMGRVPKAIALCRPGPPTEHSPQCPPTSFLPSDEA